METSSELWRFVLDRYKSMQDGDASFSERHLSQRDGALMIGTDPAEWWAFDSLPQALYNVGPRWKREPTSGEAKV